MGQAATAMAPRGRPVELLEPSTSASNSQLASPKQRNAAERALEGTIEGVKSGLRSFQQRLTGAGFDDAVFDVLHRLHALASKAPVPAVSGEAPSEELIVQLLARIAAADEPVVRQVIPQLVAIACRSAPPLARLDTFLVTQCSCSHDFAMECCWALLAERAPSQPELLARAEALLVSCERAGRLSLHIDASPRLRRTLSMPAVKRRPDAPGAAASSAPADAAAPPPAPPVDDVSELRLLHLLVAVAARLKMVPKSRRQQALQSAMQQLDNRLHAQRSACTWHATPLRAPPLAKTAAPLRVLRVCAAESHAFSTKERVPYIVYFELASCADYDAFAPNPGARPRAASTLVSPPHAHAAGADAAARLADGFQVLASLASVGVLAEQPGSLTPEKRAAFAPRPAQPTAPTAPAGGERRAACGVPMAAGPDAELPVVGEEHDALSQLSSKQVILQDLPREMSGSEDDSAAATSTATATNGVDWVGARAQADERTRRAAVFGEPFADRQARLARQSTYASWPSWHVLAVVVKANDELRQEQFAMQLISTLDLLFRRARLPLALRPYRITATGADSGLIEGINDAVSLDTLKQRTPHCASLAAFFREQYGGNRRPAYHRARLNFARSAAAYSIVCYLLQIKDRHNGNIMLTSDGCAPRASASAPCTRAGPVARPPLPPPLPLSVACPPRPLTRAPARARGRRAHVAVTWCTSTLASFCQTRQVVTSTLSPRPSSSRTNMSSCSAAQSRRSSVISATCSCAALLR